MRRPQRRLRSCWPTRRGERERPGRRIDPDGRPAPGLGLHGTEVLELHDRGVVALAETSVASSTPRPRQRLGRLS